MATERLERHNWHTYFDAISKVLPGKQAEIEVNALSIGAQIEQEYAPLLGIVYDHKSEVLEVILEGLDHTISNVREIYVDHDGVRLNSVQVIDDDGVQQIIKLRDPVLLPAPQAAAAPSQPGHGESRPG